MDKFEITLNRTSEAKNNKKDFSGDTAPSGAGHANYFELILLNYLSHFSKLMELYQAEEEEK